VDIGLGGLQFPCERSADRVAGQRVAAGARQSVARSTRHRSCRRGFPQTALLVTVKPDRVADYEAVIRALQEGLSRSTDERQRTLASGWRVYKSHDDPKGNAVFVHVIDPVVPQTDYRPSLILDEILAGASAELLAKYRDAIAGAPAMLGMNEFAIMSQPPPRPANASPPGPQ
jgi:hypothetical protein